MLDKDPVTDRDEPSLVCYSVETTGMPLSRVDSASRLIKAPPADIYRADVDANQSATGKTTRDADVVHGPSGVGAGSENCEVGAFPNRPIEVRRRDEVGPGS